MTRLCDAPNERYSIGLVLRMNDEPIYLATERFLVHNEMKSHEQGTIFSYDTLNREQVVVLKDLQGQRFEVSFSMQKAE